MVLVLQGLLGLLMLRQQAAHMQREDFPVLHVALCSLRRQVLDHAAASGGVHDWKLMPERLYFVQMVGL